MGSPGDWTKQNMYELIEMSEENIKIKVQRDKGVKIQKGM